MAVGEISVSWTERGSEYFKLSDGTLVQWGSFAINGGDLTKIINFHIPFITKNELFITLSPISFVVDLDWNVNYEDSSTTYFAMGRRPQDTTVRFYWLAIGRWK